MPDRTKEPDSTPAASASRGANWALVLFCGLFLLLFAILYFVLPDESFSELENSALQTRPQLSFSSLNEPSFSEELENFYTDQLPLRYSWLSLKAGAELALGRQENNGVFLGRENYLIKRQEYADLSDLERNLEAAGSIIKTAETSDIPAVLAVAPRAEDILSDLLPEWYDSSYADVPWDLVRSSGLPQADLLRPLKRAPDPSALWFRTDHHWSTAGAYVAYCEIATSLGFEPAPENLFSPVSVTDSFTGTSYGTSGMYWLPGESLTLYRYAGDDRFLVTLDGKEQSGFYDWSALTKRNAYEIFFGGNYARISITDPDRERPTLLVIKDSFANSVLPFLAIDYDLEVVDPRYFRGSLDSLLQDTAPCGILILVGLDSLSTMPLLTKLP